MNTQIRQSHKRMLDLIGEIEAEIRRDSYNLTRNDQDALYARLSAFREVLNEKYSKVNKIIDIW